MSRPKPKILLNYTHPVTFKADQILEADGIYAVFYKNRPINLRSLNSFINFSGLKYRKSSFSNSGHAFNLCNKLNELFNTTEFTVVLNKYYYSSAKIYSQLQNMHI